MKKILGALFFLMTTSIYSWSQIQTYKGQVLDAETEQPVAFVNIVYGEGAGTVTDIDGRFEIRTNILVKELKVSCLGYDIKVVKINELPQGGDIFLIPLKYTLPTVDVLPSENPALKVMKQVVEKRHMHNPDNYEPFSCIMYHKMTLDYDWPRVLNEEEINELKDSLGIEKDSYLFSGNGVGST